MNDRLSALQPPRHVTQHQADQALLQLGRRLQAAGYRFITPTPATHQRVNRHGGAICSVDLRDVFGWSRPFAASLLEAEQLDLLYQAGIIQAEAGRLHSTVRWSSLGELLLVHSAYPTDDAEAVFFGPDTYRFARLIEAHLQQRFATVRRVADIGCGTGAGALLVARARPEANVLALDINPRALRYCAINAELAGVGNVGVYHSDVLDGVEGNFDLILANPPYMKDPRQRAYRHGGGALGEQLSLRILAQSLPRLEAQGTLLLYTGVAMVRGCDPFLEAAYPLLQGDRYGWTYQELDPDVFGEELEEPGYEQVERIAVVALTVTRLA